MLVTTPLKNQAIKKKNQAIIMLDIFIQNLFFLYEISLILTVLLQGRYLNVERKIHFTYIVFLVNILA